MARSIFNGRLTIDDLVIPIKLYSAVEPRPVSFRLLHASDQVPVQQRMVHPTTGEPVPPEATQRAIPTPEGMVVLHDAELAELEPESSDVFEILRFVEPTQLNHQWYVRPYYLGPGDPAHADSYFALARALAAEAKQGIVRWTMRKKHYRGALRAAGDYLSLITLRSTAEVVATESLPELAWPSPTPQELAMARQLVELLEGELDLDQFHDRYAEQVITLANAKAAGLPTTQTPGKPAPASAPSLADALAASIARLQEQDVA
ncbi:non-homologous end joining protein Ku [Enhygromyxa salina]|uniref:Putative DNA repair protein YkoV n=1 Tax=Enhygromyxa salina TaxID=215803 RepID=A0A2S9YXU4_9BACT|nr:Ku protein [Enhygromyxa salina]PRQ09897.1 putative DNA repair protein YkoV [Enhygromyxa salina]